MLFPTFEFFIFFVIIFFLYWYVFTRADDRKILLIAASIVFYAFFSFRFTLIMIALAAVNWGVGLALKTLKNHRPRKAVLVAATALNILYLLYFKEAYTLLGFLNRSFPQLFGEDTFLKLLAVTSVVPLGVSYYVFKCCSYIFDVYLGKISARDSFVDVVLYVIFFPQIFSGPIVHAAYFFEHLQSALEADKNDYYCIPFDRASLLILLGLAKKTIVATVLSILVTNPIFSAPMTYNTLELLFAGVTYSVVIYADFSGYSDMAIGIGMLLGFKTPANFNRPYTAQNVTDFWKRWHISFSSWLRDYVYFAFGGSRFGSARTLFSLFATMLIAGFWHGAKSTFLLWGALQGAALCVERFFTLKKVPESSDDGAASPECFIAKTVSEGEGQPLAENAESANSGLTPLLENAEDGHHRSEMRLPQSAKTKICRTILTFSFVTFSWIFFRAENLHEAFLYFASLRNVTLPFKVINPLSILLVAAGIGFQFIPHVTCEKAFFVYAKIPLVLKALLLAVAFLALQLLTASGIPDFIYFKF